MPLVPDALGTCNILGTSGHSDVGGGWLGFLIFPTAWLRVHKEK